jgi:CRP-like cAMP-binding protein
MASAVAVDAHGERIEAGLIGYEGMSGITVVLGDDRSPLSTYVQAAGQAQKIGSANFRTAMHASESLRGPCLKYVQTFMVQTAHTAIANARDTVPERLARWILMAHDRLDGDILPLKHEFLVLMLGVRRASVTEALHVLQEAKTIRTRKGQIMVLDRKKLEHKAGDSYGVPEAEFHRLIG